MLASHQRRRTKHDLTSGYDRAGTQPCLAGGRDTITMSAETRGGHAHRLLRRLLDGLFHPAWPVDHRRPDPPWRMAPQRGPSTAGLRGRVVLVLARADEPAVVGRSGQHHTVADLLCDRRCRWRPGLGLGARSGADGARRGGLWGRRGPVSPDRAGGGRAWHGRRSWRVGAAAAGGGGAADHPGVFGGERRLAAVVRRGAVSVCA